MSLSPGVGEIGSPDIFMPDIRCNLNDDGKFDVREPPKTENMCVYARVRPMLSHEENKGYEVSIAAIDEKTVRALVPVASAKYKSSRQNEEIYEDYTFNSAFGPETGQFVFFQDTMLNTMQNFIEGSNSLVFSYGITGSGKTYTLQGNSENPGIIPLSLKLYFASIEKQLMKDVLVKPFQYNDIVALSESDRLNEFHLKKQLMSLYDDECETAPGSFRNNSSKSFAKSLCDFFSDDCEMEERQTTLPPEEMAAAQAATQLKEISRRSADQQVGICSVWVSFIEIYNEQIFDLLQPFSNKRTRLSIGEDKHGNVYIKGAREVCVSNSDEALKILNIGRKQLRIASTKMNYQSSRSHCIYSLRVIRVSSEKNLSFGNVSRLSFCDLAGSERSSKTQTTGIRLKEASAINTSLLVLGRCLEQLRMNQMGKEKRLVPFRESKLTRIFSNFFLGQGKAVMIANASPSDYSFDETLHVLKFSALARKLSVNDTFMSTTSSTLQNISNQWHLYKANTSVNTSLNNESMESVDSDSDIIQMKDDLIEKLLDLADQQRTELLNVKHEKADLEIKIRQDVCREYSVYSDQLLENQRKTFEEEIASIKESNKRRFEKTEKMYEDIIKGYKDQLGDSESEESFASTSVDPDESFKESSRKSLTSSESSFSTENPAKSKEVQKLEADVRTLKTNLLAITDELEKTKQQLIESQNASSNFELELSVSKQEYKKLANQCTDFQNAITKYTSSAEKYENDLQTLQEKLSSAIDELSASKEQVQQKDFSIRELETELNISKQEYKKLTNQCTDFQNDITNSTSSAAKYENDMQTLQEKLSSVIDELNASKEQVQQKDFNICELETEMEECKTDIGSLKENIKDLKVSHEANIEKYRNSVRSLEERLLSSQSDCHSMKQEVLQYSSNVSEQEKEINTYKNELKALKDRSQEEAEKNKEVIHKNEDCINALKKEIEAHRKEIDELRRNSKEVSSAELMYRKDIEEYKEKVCALEQDLLSVNKSYELSKKDVKLREVVNLQLEKEIDDYKEKIEELEIASKAFHENEEKLKLEVEKYKKSINDLEHEVSALQQELISAKKEQEQKLHTIGNLEKEIDLHKLEIESLKKDKKESVEKLESKIDTSHHEVVSDLKSKLSVANKEIAALKENIQQKTSLMSELKKEIEAHKLEIEELKKNELKYKTENAEVVSDLESKLSASNVETAALEENIQEMTGFVSELKEEIEAHKLEIEELQKNELNYKAANGEILSNLESKLSAVNGEIKAQKENIQQMTSLEAKLKEEIETSKLKIEELQKNELKYKTENEVVSDLESKLSAAKKEIATLKENIQQKTCFISELKEEIEAHKLEMEELQKKELKYETENMELKRQVETFRLRISELEEGLSSFREQHEEAQKQLEQKSAKICLLNDEVDSLKLKIEERKLSQKALQSEKLELVGKINIQDKKYEDLEKELASARTQLTSFKKIVDDPVNIPQLKELKCKIKELKEENEKLQDDQRITDAENLHLKTIVSGKEEKIDDLEKQFSFSEIELKSAKSEICQMTTKLQELKNSINSSMLEIKQLKESQQKSDAEKSGLELEISSNEDRIKKLQEKLSLTSKEFDSTKIELQQKSLKLKELENENHVYKCELENYEKVSKLVPDSSTEIGQYKENIASLEVSLESMKEELKFTKEKLQIQSLSCKELEAEVSQLKEQIEDKSAELNSSLGTTKKTIEEMENLKNNHNNLIEEFTSVSEQLKNKFIESKSLTEKIFQSESKALKYKKEADDLTNDIRDLLLVNDALQNDVNNLEDTQKLLHILEECELKATYKIKTHICGSLKQNNKVEDFNRQIEGEESKVDLEDIQALLHGLQACELRATERIQMLQSRSRQHGSQIADLNRQVRDKESNIDDLEKALCKLQTQMKEVQTACDQKLISRCEQHDIEIEQTIRLKQLVEEENIQLKKENTLLKTTEEKRGNKEKENIPKPQKNKKSESVGENVRKTSRTLRQKQVKTKNVSFTSTGSVSDEEIEAPKEKSRKRVSDDDFEASKNRASKKMKSSVDNKVPLKRTSKKRLQVPQEEGLSPVQKIVSSIGSKFRTMRDTVASHAASPRMTRGRKKLFNPEASDVTSEKVTKGRKVGGKN